MEYQIEKQWYVVSTYNGHENKVKDNLEKRIYYIPLFFNLIAHIVFLLK